MHKTAQEARARKKIEQEEEAKRIEALKLKDPEAYLGNLYEKRRALMEKI